MRYETVSAAGGQAAVPVSSLGARFLHADPVARFSAFPAAAAVTAFPATAALAQRTFAATDNGIIAGMTELAAKMDLLNAQREVMERGMEDLSNELTVVKQGLEFFNTRMEAMTQAVQALQEAAPADAVAPASPAAPASAIAPASPVPATPLP